MRDLTPMVKWLVAAAAVGVALVFLYPDSYQQDGGHHFLFARYAWVHPELFVGVWSRPLFTTVFAVPALAGYPAAKLFSVAIALATAHQTFGLARQLGLARPALAVLLLFLQPSFLLLATDTMTEPIFALVFVVALRLHLAGRVVPGMVTASFMVLARPEGFFLGVLWGVWVLVDRRDTRAWWRRIPGTFLLLVGMAVWWLAALLITGDPLFIAQNWPKDWHAATPTYGTGPVWSYLVRLPEIVGPILWVPFAAGLVVLLARRRARTVVSAFLTLFVLHSLMRTFGWFGSAGYPRYFVCVAPAMAVITLAGWNAIAAWAEKRPARSVWGQRPRRAVSTAVLAVSFVTAVFYVDTATYFGRDAWAVKEMTDRFRANPRPISRLYWSQAYMCILLDRDPWERPPLTPDKAATLAVFRAAPSGTLVFWDGDTGPSWFGVTADDIEQAGYERLRSATYEFDGWLGASRWLDRFPLRRQEMHLLYKP